MGALGSPRLAACLAVLPGTSPSRSGSSPSGSSGRRVPGRWQPGWWTLAAACVVLLGSAPEAFAMRARTHEQVGFQLFESPQENPIVLNATGTRLYVANTTSHTVSVINPSTNVLILPIEVGVDPVSLAIRPGANELWVSNHVSDSVSVIDIAPGSPTENRVVDTVQSIDAQGATQFDAPVGIAFTADGSKAYVALSSRNQIAVVDAAARTITGRIQVRSQEPRAIQVRNGLLYVLAFDVGNKTQLGLCLTSSTTDPNCGLGFSDLVTFATSPNLPGLTKNIVFGNANPNRALFVYRTDTDAEVAAVTDIGTLNYGLTVSSTGRAFVAATDARNAVNGIVAPAGSRQDVNGDGNVNLADLEDRMFDNRIAATSCTTSGCGAVTITNLEPPNPTPNTALATPYALAISGDDATLVGTALGSSRVFALDPNSMVIQSRVDLGSTANGDFGQQMPSGIALLSGPGGAPQTAYVLNSLENTVSVIDVSDPANLQVITKFAVGSDPTPAAVRRGRIAFNNAFASSTGTFSCGSCHPDGNTDQLLWRIGGQCFLSGCVAGEDEPRTTMPIRGLKNTLPLHWDGTLGDPFGGGNGAVGFNGAGGTDCSLTSGNGDHDCFRDLVNVSLAGVLCEQTPSCAIGPSGAPGLLTNAERDDMATFLAAVSYPPARSRRIDDTLSTASNPVTVMNGDGTPSSYTADALDGFRKFFTDQGGQVTDPNTCADSTAGCHVLPLTAGTNSSTLNGFDVPTMRGMTDRFEQFSIAPTNVRALLTLLNSGGSLGGFTVSPLEPPIQYSGSQAKRPITIFGAAFALFEPFYNVRPLDIFQMFEEASTGYSGAQARQVELNARTAGSSDTDTELSALELADARGLVNLRAVGVRDAGSGLAPIVLSYRSDGTWKNANDSLVLTHGDLLAEAQAGTAILTATAGFRSGFQVPGTGTPQPLLGACVSGCSNTTGDPPLPNISKNGPSNPSPFTVVGTDVRQDATIFVDGQPASGTLGCGSGVTGNFCTNGNVSIDLDAKPAAGLHLVQVLNPTGPLSNELPVCVGTSSDCN
jgi:YVTN family beta-propeller protein